MQRGVQNGHNGGQLGCGASAGTAVGDGAAVAVAAVAKKVGEGRVVSVAAGGKTGCAAGFGPASTDIAGAAAE